MHEEDPASLWLPPSQGEQTFTAPMLNVLIGHWVVVVRSSLGLEPAGATLQ